MGSNSSSLQGLTTEQVLWQIGEYLRDRNMSLIEAFTFLDVDQSGFVTWDEFFKGVQTCVEGMYGYNNLTLETLYQVFLRFDANKDGKMGIQEFAAAFTPPAAAGSTSFSNEYSAIQQAPSFGAYSSQPPKGQNLAQEVLVRIASSISRTGFTPQQLFAALDKDNSGALSRIELENMVVSFQPDLSLSEREAVFQMFDTNRSGSIDSIEFCKALQNVNAGALVTIEEKLKLLGQKFKDQGFNVFETFSVFDRNGDGFLARDEWQRSMGILGAQLDEKDLESTFRYFDSNNDGYVSLVEFRNFFQDTLDRAPSLQQGVMPTYIPPPVEQPWETEVFDLVRSCLSVGRSGFGITEVFRRLDITKSNTLTPYEFTRVLTTYRPELTQPQCDQLFSKVNTSQSGAITMGEFVRRFG